MTRFDSTKLTRRQALLGGIGSWMAGCSRKPPVDPKIEFTSLPPSGQGSAVKLDAIAGRVTGARHGERIVLFARAGIWWVQPFDSQAFTTIQSDNTWKNTTHPGSAYAALLVGPGYNPPPTMKNLPEKGGSIRAVAIAEEMMVAPLALPTLRFSGYEWAIRETPNNPGGTTNLYDRSNAWTDENGFLHLRINKHGDQWKSAEISLSSSLGYGSYRFVVRDVSRLEPSAVFAMSTWDDSGPAREMDIEIGRWGETDTKDAQFVVQPYYVPANTFRFATQPGTLEYSIRWEPGRVLFRTAPAGSSSPANIVAEHVFTSGVPAPGNEVIHLNHYVFGDTRAPLQRGSEVIVEKFEYLP